MIVSSASPLARMVSTYSRCSAVSGVSSSSAGHADDAVHRRADLVAHARQERALRLRRGLRRLFRGLQLAVGVAHLVAQPADVAAHHREPRQRDDHDNQLEDFLAAVDLIRFQPVEARHHDAVGRGRERGEVQQLPGAQPEHREQARHQEDDHQRAAAAIREYMM